MRISIAGTGYVGLVTGVCLAEKGHDVTCVDIDQQKVARINADESPIYEPGLDELLARNLGQRFRAVSDLRAAVLNSDLTMIAVGTPFDGQRIDLTFVKAVAKQIGQVLAEKDDYHTVIVKSTVVPGTTDDVVEPILEQASGKLAGVDFGVGSNPEFLSEGTAAQDFMMPDRIVLGGDERTQQVLEELYEVFPSDVPRLATSVKAAEMIKYASNSLLATLISFSNEIGNLCAALGGVDIREVMQGVHLSQYLSPRQSDGSRVKAPISAFLAAGCGFGGSCLPKDVAALIRHGQEHSEAMPLLSAVIEINRGQPKRMVELLEKHFPSLAGVNVAVLGLAFKPDTDDVRESPALEIVRRLIDAGANVKTYDPIANASFARAFGASPVKYCESLVEVLAGVDAALLVTRWQEFQQVPELLAGRYPPPPLVDGRRVIDPDAVECYEGIGVETAMQFTPTTLAGAFVIDLQRRTDDRGYFARSWCQREFQQHGLNVNVVQINTAFSPKAGTLRGLHWQDAPHAEVKIVSCHRGAIYDVIVDVRPESPTCGQWEAFELTGENARMLYVPEGFAHGYQTLVDDVQVSYQTTDFYAPQCCRGLRFDDGAIEIRWPLDVSIVSPQDRAWPDFAAVAASSGGQS